MRVGILGLQGDVREHVRVLRELGAAAQPVKTAAELEHCDALVLPGGESTTIGFLLAEHGLLEPLRKSIESGMPTFGTCAGLILLAREIRGGEVPRIGALDAVVHRNAYGRQVDSFEDDVEVDGIGAVRGVFIRAPVIEQVGSEVTVLAEQAGKPVVVRQGRILAASFHPELTDDDRMHRFFLETVCA